jgi:cytochrome c oxidase cbb3-type subunit 2
MDRGMVIFVGALLTFSSSWLGLILYPYWQLQGEQPYTDPQGQADEYPRPLAGKALAGRQVYVANGCMYCHSQQLRSERFGNWWEDGQMKTGADIKRGWGTRRTVSRDYIYDQPALLGTMRTGPDLAAVGPRYSEDWQHRHTFNPRSVNAWSIMPSFAFLYSREKVVGGPDGKSPKALNLGREWTVDPGYRWRPSGREWDRVVAEQGPALLERYGMSADLSAPAGKRQLLEFWLTTPEEDYQVVPTADGEALVAYLLALNKNEVPLPEAKE